MDVQKKLDEIVAAVESARSMPMSASCVVHRAELLGMLAEVREALPDSLAQAEELLGGSEQVVQQARQEAERIIETAHSERSSMIAETEIVQRSRAEADKILAAARQEAAEIRAEADDYVDSKLANFEVVLTKTLGSVGRGREKLLGTGTGLDADGYEDPDYAEAPERSQDPDTLRERADAYVDLKLGAFEAVLSKTLEAVGRGRQKLHGRVATDELGALAAESPHDGGTRTSDADYLADLADPAARPAEDQPAAVPPRPVTPPAPAQQPAAAASAAQPYQNQQGYPEVPDQQRYPAPGQDAQGYPAQDPYAYPNGYPQQDPYQQDVYAYQQPYAQQPYPQQDGYPQQDAYGYPQQGYDPAQASADYGATPGQDSAALDETSLFDTSMISAEQLRQFEQQRQYGQGR